MRYRTTIVLLIALVQAGIVAQPVRSQEIAMMNILVREYDLEARYKPGDRDYYYISTIYRSMNDTGRVSSTQKVEGWFSREIISTEPGGRVDYFQWKGAHMIRMDGSGAGKSESWEFSRGFTYSISFQDLKPEQGFPIPKEGIPGTMDGWLFFVLAVDAHTFDVIASPDSYNGPLRKIGDRAVMDVEGIPVNMDFSPLFSDTYFINGPLSAWFTGITLSRNKPAALLSFRCDDSRLHMVTEAMNVKAVTEAASYYWGEVALSLTDLKISHGFLRERVDALINVPTVELPMKRVNLREIEIRRLSQQEYNRIVF
jgi:hypothetical protein